MVATLRSRCLKGRLFPTLVAVTLAAVPVLGEPLSWQLVSLHPPGAESSQAFGVSGRAVVGYFYEYSGRTHGSYWGADGIATVLPDSGGTWPTGVSGATIVGYARGPVSALMWQGAGQTLVQLAAPGPESSYALATDGVAQVGSIGAHAVIWHATPESVVDVHPTGAWASTLRAIDGSGEAGDISVAAHGPPHAALWHGTADSVVDLHPAGAYASSAQAISNGRQGGYVRYTPVPGFTRAAVWSGTADSFLDITPDTTFGAQIYGMDGNVAVGDTLYHGYEIGQGHAIVWTELSNDASFDLHSLLSSDYTSSTAYAVDVDEFGTIRVVGSAYNSNYYLPDGTFYPRNEAMMWVLVPEPSSLAALGACLAALRPRRRKRC